MKKYICCFIFLAFSTIFLNARSFEEIKKEDKIRIGVIDYSMLPGISLTNQRFQMFEHELAKQIAEELLGSKESADLVIVQPNDERINELMEDKVDVLLAALSINEERKNIIDLSLPYFFTNTAFLTKKGSQIIKLNDLANKKLGVAPDSTAEVSLEKFNYIKVACSPEECFNLLKEEKIDAYVDDDLTLYEFEARDPRYEISIKRVGKTVFFALGINKNNKNLLAALDQSLIKLAKSGYLEYLYNEQLKPLHQTESSKFLLDNLYQTL